MMHGIFCQQGQIERINLGWGVCTVRNDSGTKLRNVVDLNDFRVDQIVFDGAEVTCKFKNEKQANDVLTAIYEFIACHGSGKSGRMLVHLMS